jgi:hypothetical protein
MSGHREQLFEPLGLVGTAVNWTTRHTRMGRGGARLSRRASAWLTRFSGPAASSRLGLLDVQKSGLGFGLLD